MAAQALSAPAETVRLAAAGRYSRSSALAAVLLGSACSSFASWLAAPPGTRGPAAAAASTAGHMALDLVVWYVAAALLAQSAMLLGAGGRVRPDAAAETETEAAETETGAGGRDPDKRRESLTGDFMTPSSVAFAVRAYLLPASAVARLTGVAAVLGVGRLAVWVAGLVLLWLTAKEAGGLSSNRAASCVLLGLLLPAAVVLAGLALAGLAWLLAPLLPKGITPFPQI